MIRDINLYNKHENNDFKLLLKELIIIHIERIKNNCLTKLVYFSFVRSFHQISSLRQKYNNLGIDRIKERNKSKVGRIGIKSIRYNIDTRVHDISSHSFDTHGFYSFSRDITRLHPYTRDENGDGWKVLRCRIEDYVCKKIAEKSKQQRA